MWRFILVSFAFLGWAFYSLSGGADYTPASNSLQAQKAQQVTMAKLDGTAAEGTEGAAKAVDAAGKIASKPQGENAQVALNDIQASNEYDPKAALPATDANTAAEAQVQLAAADNMKTDATTDEANQDVAVTRVEFDSALDAFKSGPKKVTEVRSTGDIRRVTGNSVNLRSGPGTNYDRVGQLSSGTEVEVLSGAGADWVELQVVSTGEIGWMSSSLVSASN